jgi:hypothetical protein
MDEMTALGLLEIVFLVAVVMVCLVWRARQQLTLFVLRIDQGRIQYIKGRLPRRLLVDIADVADRDRVNDLVVICRIEDGRSVLSFQGTYNAGMVQVLRNLVGEYPLMRLKQAPRVKPASRG